eukprot:scpid91075/ scgid1292/ 
MIKAWCVQCAISNPAAVVRGNTTAVYSTRVYPACLQRTAAVDGSTVCPAAYGLNRKSAYVAWCSDCVRHSHRSTWLSTSSLSSARPSAALHPRVCVMRTRTVTRCSSTAMGCSCRSLFGHSADMLYSSTDMD